MEFKKKKNVEEKVLKEELKEENDLSENEEIKEESKEKPTKTKKIIIKEKSSLVGILILVLIIVIVGGIFLKNVNDNRITITAKASLQKIIEINELSTVQYTYNAIATKYNSEEDKEKNNAQYYVKYEGIVKAGIDFNEVQIDIDKAAKKIKVTLPEVEIHETSVDMGTLDYIFVKKQSESSSVSQEAYKLCKEDLKNRVENEVELKDIAKENARDALKGLLEPWAKSLNNGYELEIN